MTDLKLKGSFVNKIADAYIISADRRRRERIAELASTEVPQECRCERDDMPQHYWEAVLKTVRSLELPVTMYTQDISIVCRTHLSSGGGSIYIAEGGRKDLCMVLTAGREYNCSASVVVSWTALREAWAEVVGRMSDDPPLQALLHSWAERACERQYEEQKRSCLVQARECGFNIHTFDHSGKWVREDEGTKRLCAVVLALARIVDQSIPPDTYVETCEGKYECERNGAPVWSISCQLSRAANDVHRFANWFPHRITVPDAYLAKLWEEIELPGDSKDTMT